MEAILVTGGNGTIGSGIVRHLNDHGYRTVSVDVERGPDEADTAMTADLTDAGETYGALSRAEPDAVAHMGTITNAGKHPDHVVYESNAMSAYHVLEAASALGIESLCLPSSIQAIGTTGPTRIDYLPVDERHPLRPRDPYELGKQTIEALADGFARRSGRPRTISTFRFPGVLTRDDIRDRFPVGDGTVESLDDGGNGLFAYVDVAEVADLVRRSLEADFDGHERFWVSAPDTRTNVPTQDLVEEFHPEAELRADLTGDDPLIDSGKARELLDWVPETSWRTLST